MNNSKFDLFKGVIFHPFKTISSIQQSEISLKSPLLLLLLIGIISAVESFLATRKIVTSLLEAISTISGAQRFARMIALISGVFSFFAGFLGIFIAWIGATITFHILSRLLGGEGRFKKLLEIEGWCFLPQIFGVIVELIVVAFYFPSIELPAQLFSDPTQFRQIVENLTKTLQLSTAMTFSRVFRRMMTFWVLFLSGIAINKEYGLSKVKTAMSVLLPYFVYFTIFILLRG